MIFVYFVLFIFPFPLNHVPGLETIIGYYGDLWNALVPWVGTHVFGVAVTVRPNGSGDTTYNYIQTFCMLIAAIAVAAVWTIIDRRPSHDARLYRILRVIVRFYLAEDRFFPDIDRAIEWAEDGLLQTTDAAPSLQLPLDGIPLLRDFEPDQIERLRSRLEPVAWPAGHVIFRHGDPGSCLYLVTSGRASVHLRHDDEGIRLVTFAPGAVFGELALLDRGPRSATVTADEDLTGFGLSEASFSVLCQTEPDIAIKLLSALGRELSVRIRYANMTIQQLET